MKVTLRELFLLVAIVAMGCGGCATPVEPLKVQLGGTADEWLVQRLDTDGDAALTNEVQLTIAIEGNKSFTVRTRPTFFTVAKKVITRVVYTPMSEAGNLQQTADSVKVLFGCFPEEQRTEANEWLKGVLAKGDAEADEFTRFSNRFVLRDGTETYVEFRPVSLPGKWYSSVHLYDRDYGQ